MILIPHLIPPAAEAAAGENIHFFQLGEQFCQHSLALEGRCRVSVVEGSVVCGDYFVLGFYHVGVYQALDTFCEDFLAVDGFHYGFGDFEHDTPIGSLFRFGRAGFAAVGELLRGEFRRGLGLVVGRVVGEDRGAVEGTVVLGEVEPAFVADSFRTLAADTDADNVGCAVEEAFAEGDEFFVAHGFDEVVDGHGVDEFFVVYGCAVAEEDAVAFCVYELDVAVLAEAGLFFWEGFGDVDPDVAGTAVCWETEGCVWAPASGGLS